MSCLGKCEWDVHTQVCKGCGRSARDVERDLLAKARRGRHESKRTNLGKSQKRRAKEVR